MTDDVVPTVSVIMAVFNGETTVEMSVRSVLRQEFTDFELIVVDDASTDATTTVLAGLQSQDSRIRHLVNDTNLGQGRSRNRAIDAARGRYLAFIDADDTFEPDYLNRLHTALEETGADVAQCGIRYVYDDRDYEQSSPAGVVAGEQAPIRLDCTQDGMPYLSPHPSNKLYKAEVIRDAGVRFLPITYEDTEILPRLAAHISKFVCVPQALYCYNKRYSVITGDARVQTVEEVRHRFDSIEQAFHPYLEPVFLTRLNTWNLRPLAPTSMVRNAAKQLIGLRDAYSARTRAEVHAVVDSCIDNLLGLTPDTPFHDDLAALRGEFRAAFLGTPGWRRALTGSATRLRSAAYTVVERSMPLLDRVVPKRRGLYAYGSWGRYRKHTVDNPRMTFEHNRANPNLRNVVILNQGPTILDEVTGQRFPAINTIAALWTMLRCEKLFVGYSLHNLAGYRRLCGHPRREIVQLWHGIPVKRIGLLADHVERWWPKELPRYSHVIAASPTDQASMNRAFDGGEFPKVINTGLPRHDLLAMSDADLPADYRKMDARLTDRIRGRRLVFFAPTWRQGAKEPMVLSDADFHAVERFAREQDIVFAVRFHPNMWGKRGRLPSLTSDHLILVNDIEEANLILRRTDVLVTDYSSIYIDFMLLRRPVVLYSPDLQWYNATRGFIYPPEEFTPVAKYATTADELTEAIKAALDPAWEPSSEYLTVLNRFCAHPLDGKNAQRVMAAVEGGVQS